MNESPVWLRKVEDELLEFVSSSGGSHCPEFPLESFSKSLSKTLHTPHFSIQLGAKEWRTQDNLLSGLGKAPLSLSLELSPLEGDLFWIMPYEDICKWVSWLKSEDQKSFDLENPDLIKGIYKYTALEALSEISKLGIYQELSLKLSEKAKFEKTCYTIDISLSTEEETIWGRLVLSSSLKCSFTDFYAKSKPTLSSLKGQKNLTLPLSVRNGSIQLTQTEVKSLKEGDFMIIDNAHYHPSKENGSLTLFLNETPLFFVKPKEGELKILDYVLYQEPSYA